jgi:cell division transport system permease protein
MVTTLYRLIKYGMQAFWRQRLLTVATLVVILLALLVFQSLIIAGVIGNTALNSIQEKIDISIFFKVATPEDEILRIKRALEELGEVREVEYISRDRALEIFRETHEGDETISKALEGVGDNPLSASLNIRANNPEDYPIIDAFLSSAASPDIIEKLTFHENQKVIERLVSIIRVGRQTGALAAIFLTIVAILVSFNTILLGIYSNRDEISIMRLVGASNLYIRGPYIFVGIVYGLIAAILGMALISPFIFLSAPYVKLFVPEIDLVAYFSANFFRLFLYNLAFGVGIGVVSSFIAIRRYLHI